MLQILSQLVYSPMPHFDQAQLASLAWIEADQKHLASIHQKNTPQARLNQKFPHFQHIYDFLQEKQPDKATEYFSYSLAWLFKPLV